MTAATAPVRPARRVRRHQHVVVAVAVFVACLGGEATPHVDCVMEVPESAAMVVAVGGTRK